MDLYSPIQPAEADGEKRVLFRIGFGFANYRVSHLTRKRLINPFVRKGDALENIIWVAKRGNGTCHSQ